MRGLSSVVAKHRCSLSPSLIAIQRARALVRRRVARVVALPRPCDDVRDCARELRRRRFSGETACTRRWFLRQTSSLSLIAVTLRIRATLVHGFRGFRDRTIEGRVSTGVFLQMQFDRRDPPRVTRSGIELYSQFGFLGHAPRRGAWGAIPRERVRKLAAGRRSAPRRRRARRAGAL